MKIPTMAANEAVTGQEVQEQVVTEQVVEAVQEEVVTDLLQEAVTEQVEEVVENANFGETVNSLVKSTKRDDNGNFLFEDESLSEEVKYAVSSEAGRRRIQAEDAKKKHQIDLLTAERDELYSKVQQSTKWEVSEDDQAKLDELEATDLEAWHNMKNVIEEKNSSGQKEEIDTVLGEVSQKAAASLEFDRRMGVLETFQVENPTFVLREEDLDDIPPRYTKRLGNNEISFETFLIEVRDYFAAGTVVANPSTVSEIPNMGEIGGSVTPPVNAQTQQAAEDYKNQLL